MVRLGAAGGVVGLFLICAAVAQAAALVPHRAIYVVSLESADPGSGISAVSGELGLDWSGSCAGWTMEHQSFMDISFAGREPVRLATMASTWESRDSTDYHFSVRNLTNGKPSESIEGRARLSPADLSGKAVFTLPKKIEKTLPPGTLFPAAHTAAMVRAAAGAPTMISTMVFDGMTVEGGFNVNTVFGRIAGKETGAGKVAELLRGHRSWPVHMAYFRVGDRSSVPRHEIGLRLFDNGVEDRILLSFKDFKVRARLSRIEMGKSPDCGD